MKVGFACRAPGNFKKKGYIVIIKPTMELPDGTVKGNVDAELVLHTMIQYPKYSKAIIVSGDADFIVYLKEFSGFIIRVDQLRNSLEWV